MNVPTDDGFKWFGEGFEGFPKRLPDDTIEYTIHIVDSRSNDLEVRSKLNDVLKASNEQTKTLLKSYIWQRDVFKLELKRVENRWTLTGQTSFGDCIADEWLVVYLLRELSKTFPQIWVRVHDGDGEFVLIEAANVLPKWLNPEIAKHRVWMNRGQLRIIPLQDDSTTYRNLTLQQALDDIRQKPNTLIHSPLIEEEAFYRLQNYPKEIETNMHHSLITIPRKLAYILHAKPAFTSPAVEAFYLRDPIALRPLQQASVGNLKFLPADFVTISAIFNKTSFAQIKSQEFEPPATWADVFPASSDAKEVARREVGLKPACGFEMLVQDLQNKDKKAVREISLLLEDLEAGEESLPTDSDMAKWPQQGDDDTWLDINFEDFEKTLAGKAKGGAKGKGDAAGDGSAQDNLRKMVERFERFMNDDTAGPDGAELDDMDFDDDDDEDLSEDESGEDRDVSFDENEFARMMREMMGLPAEQEDKPTTRLPQGGDIQELDSEDEEIRKLSERMEAELNASGALNLNPTPSKLKAVSDGAEQHINKKGKGKANAPVPAATEGEDESDDHGDQEISIDYNLAKNLLEAFKGQTGLAGPAGNMMGLMGINLPRDEKDGNDGNKK